MGALRGIFYHSFDVCNEYHHFHSGYYALRFPEFPDMVGGTGTLYVCMAGFAVSFTARREKHIRIDAAINLYPKKIRPYIEILSEIIVLAFSIFIAITGVTVFQKITWSGQISPAIGLPMQFVYAAPLVGFVLTAIRQIECIIKRIKNLNKPEEVSKV